MDAPLNRNIGRKIEGVAQRLYDVRDILPGDETRLYAKLDRLAYQISRIAGSLIPNPNPTVNSRKVRRNG